ncbi:hypothetical protein ACHAWO_005015 [Cyclotella atomus]|uniref:ESF1 RRM domain-containing protein n=1 Tax=Cyclotella atomus TaxID=382360 RepID=A0ABD3PVX8_9STRA
MPKSKKKAPKTKPAADSDDIKDERFIAAATRPQFKSGRKIRKDEDDSDDDADLHAKKSSKTKAFEETFGESLTAAIQSDSRFAEALTNQEKFGCVPLMDKYGRKTKKKKSKQLDDVDKDDDVSNRESKGDIIEQDEPQNIDMKSRIAYLNALSRGEISGSSSDDDSSDESSVDKDANDQDSDDDSSGSIDVHGKAGVFDPSFKQLSGDANSDEEGVELTDSPTPYLAILNLDWTNIRAVDIYAMLQSFCPPGTLKKVEVYPSDFGNAQMEKERVQGPSGLWKKPKKSKQIRNDDSETDDTSSDSEESEGQHDKLMEEQSNESAATDESEEEEEDMSEDDDVEDILNLNEATAKLYSHFPPQSEVTKNSRGGGDNSDEEGFDREKLRAYEASKLRYYFAIATFSSSGAAEKVYTDVDGMEMEHSAAEIDIRALPADDYEDTIEGRELRDECDHLPGKYAPPDTVVAALRQSRVSCSWETGDAERDKKLTRWGMGKDAWSAMAEGDDIKFYLASDNSSAGEGSDSDNDVDAKDRKQTKQKAANMRSLLGLGGSDDDEMIGNDSEADASSDESQSSGNDEPSTKQVTFTPGKGSLEEKIRSKINNAEDETEELTPFQKYLEKRKQKRKERKAAARNKKLDVDEEDNEAPEDDGMYGYDPEFGMAKFSDEDSDDEAGDRARFEEDAGDDDFFLEDKNANKKKAKRDKRLEKKHEPEPKAGRASTKEELELLIAGDDDEEHVKDYDMRGLAKLERHAGKKLKGKRKRQMETLAANVSGQEFQIDTSDDRFAALLDGADDRFGIDRTNPMYKETGAMKTLLEEQTKRRKNRGKKQDSAVTSQPSKEADTKITGDVWIDKSGGAMALSSLVKSLQQKVKN